MYRLLIIMLITACGGNDGNKDQAPTPPQEPAEIAEPPQSMSLAVSSSDIPACTDTNKNQLIYVTDLKQFQTCDTTWIVIEMPAAPAGKDGTNGTNGEDGATVEAVFNLTTTVGDLCTRYSNENCYWDGGTLVRYTSGLIQFQGRMFYHFEYDDSGDYNSDSYIASSVPNYCGPGFEFCAAGLDFISRTGSVDTKKLWLVHYPASALTKLIFDTNDNDVLDTTDEAVTTFTETNIILN